MAGFTPSYNVAVTMTGSSVNTALSALATAVESLYLYNSSSTNKMFVKWGVGAQTAAADGSCFALPPGAYFVVNKGLADNVAVIGTSGDVAYISAGEGQ